MWDVSITRKAGKAAKLLPVHVLAKLEALLADLRINGPVRGNWPNYGKLSDTKHHCHIRNGKPCYVAVWEVTDKAIQLIEVQYVGTHEDAPY